MTTWKPGMFERSCDGCTMCCKLPAVPEIDKPANTWCKHCAIGKYCKIYQERPQGCKDFMCLWKVMPDFPEELKPDKCKVIWQMTEDGLTAVATTEYPKAMETLAMKELISKFHAIGVKVYYNGEYL